MDENVPLARYTTIGTGGPARYFEHPATVEELQEALRFAVSVQIPAVPIGLGSNLLVHDDGVDAVVLKLSGELAQARIDGSLLVAGGGAANAVCLHRARAAGKGGFEFASAIPGTVGGGVAMNAGAYGIEWRDVLVDAVIVSAQDVRRRATAEVGLSYRHSGLGPGEIVAEARFRLHDSSTDEVKSTAAELLARRKATQPTNKRTFGSVFKNPDAGPGAGALIEECGLKGYAVGGAIVSPRHANFIENTGGATSSDCLAVMVEARRRVHERFGIMLEHEVRFLGPLELPPL